MKILFVSYHNPHFLSITEYCEAALRSLGHEYVAFDDRQFFLPGRVRDRFAALQRWDLRRLNERLLRVAGQFRPDACLAAGGYRMLPATLRSLKSRGITTALWTTDPPVDFKPIYETAREYDVVFCGGSEAIKLLAPFHLRQIFFLPFAAAAQYHKPVSLTAAERERYACDIAFVGSYYKNRWETLEQISDFDLGVWGPGWEKIPPASRLSRCIRSHAPVTMDEWLKIFAAAKMVIAIHFQDGVTPCYQMSPKVFESLACQRFLLVDNQPDVRRSFGDGKHLVIFRDIRDLRRKIEYYLAHDAERQNIERQGREEIMTGNLYTHRMQMVLRIIQEVRG